MTPLPVALYSRYSTDRQDSRSIEDQVRRCRRFANERGYVVAREFSDAAMSGATMEREGLQLLLAEAGRGKRSAFRAVLVDDLSRLSRDLGSTWRIVFEDLAAAGVKVVDCTTGMASDGAGARLTFGAMALVNDTFLQLVKTETHRGLEGRARAGFWPGGACYGFTTVPEENPQDPLHPRAVPRISEAEAEVVRRVFRERADGESLARIADRLNSEKIPAPQDDSPKKRAGSGWSRSQLYSMLRNERYRGRFVWNRRCWFRDPVSKRRRYRDRPEAEWVVTERPELAIIDAETWDRVQARNRAWAERSGSTAYASRHEHMLSGHLRCGACGAPMSIVSRAHKNGRSWSNFGCSARHSKGDVVCSNNRTISELRIDRAVLKALRQHAESPQFETWVENGIRAAQRVAAAPSDDPVARLEAQVKAQERQVAKATDLLFDVGASEALKARLHAEETKLRELRAQLRTAAPKTVPQALREVSKTQVIALLDEASTLARKAPRRAGKIVASLIEPLVLRPVEKGYEGDVWLRNTTAALAGGRVCEKVGCGGRI